MTTLTSGHSEVIDMPPSSSPNCDMASPSLIKSEHITVVRRELPAGKQVPSYHAKGDLSFFCLSGKIEFTAGEAARSLSASQLILLAGRAPQWPIAIEDSALLVTVSS